MTYKIIDLEQGTPEWKKFREGKIGSSYAAIIMGEGFETPLQLWERLVFGREKYVTEAMKRGTELEAKAREWVNAKLKAEYKPAVLQSEMFPDLIASLDGFYERGGVPFLLEIKSPGLQDHLDALGGVVPSHYWPQLQHQMEIANVDQMLYLSFDGKDGTLIEVARDKEYCKKLFASEMAFLDRINEFKPPEPLDKDWVEESDYEKVKKAQRRIQLREMKNEIEAEMSAIDAELKEGLDHPRVKIGSLRLQKILKKGAVDYGKIEILRGVDLERYRKEPVTYWRID